MSIQNWSQMGQVPLYRARVLFYKESFDRRTKLLHVYDYVRATFLLRKRFSLILSRQTVSF